MKFELIESYARFIAVASPWNALWQQRDGSPFQSHAWLKACVDVSSPDLQLHIGTIWDGPRMTAVVPFIVRRRGLLRVLEWISQDLSDYCDGLGDLADLTACWRRVFAHGGYDVSRLKNVRADAAVAGLLASTAAISQTDEESCRLLRSRWPDGATWLAQQWPKKRNAYSRGLKKLQERGAVEISFHTQIPPEVVTQLVSMKEAWIRTHHALEPVIHQGWLAPLVDALVSIDRLLVTLLTCDGVIIAGSVSILHGTKMLSYFTTYDLAYTHGSPGIVLLTETIRWAWDHGYTEHDHLRGDHAYKLPFSNDECGLYHYVGVGSMRGRCAVAAKGLASLWAKRQRAMTIPAATASACEVEQNRKAA
jgi:CelD/BcsL family acetyltransferase involved in cellulose biosynthesis